LAGDGPFEPEISQSPVVAMSRTDRVALLMLVDTCPDPENMLTWTINGREPTAEELTLLKAITPQDAQDAVDLWRVARDVMQARAESRDE